LSFPGLRAISLFNRLQHLKRQKEALEKKRGRIFRNSDVEQVIEALDVEMQRVRNDLKDATESGEKHT